MHLVVRNHRVVCWRLVDPSRRGAMLRCSATVLPFALLFPTGQSRTTAGALFPVDTRIEGPRSANCTGLAGHK